MSKDLSRTYFELMKRAHLSAFSTFSLSATSVEAFLSPLRHQGGFSNCLLLLACCWGGSLLFVVREPVVWQLIVWLLFVGEVVVWQLVVGGGDLSFTRRRQDTPNVSPYRDSLGL